MKNLIGNLKLFFQSSLGKQSINYFLFYAFVWALHLIIISVISYFHLILNHNIGTIADWIVDRGWVVIIFTKLIIFSVVLQFMKLRTKNYVHIRGMLRNAISWPRHESFVLILFLLIGIVSLANVHLNVAYIIDIGRLFFSIVGTLVFFGIDLFFILILDVFNPIKSEEEIHRKIILFAFYFYFFTRITFIYEQMVSFKLFSYFILLLYSAYWRRRNWTLPVFVMATFLIPIFVLFGLDPVWGSSFSLFNYSSEISASTMFVLILFGCAYLEFRKHKYPEYIYRD